MKDYILRAINKNKTIRIFIGDMTNLVEEARKTHGSSATATAALGRTLIASTLMSQDLKEDDYKLTLTINGGGPIGNIVCVGDKSGRVKGYVDRPQADIESRADGKLDVGGIVGRTGYLSVIKDIGLKDPYTGQTQLVSGEIGEDLAYYYYLSEQQPSVVNLGVLVDKDLSVISAGGYIIHLMPDALEEEIVELESIIEGSPSMSELIEKGYRPEDILEKVFSDLEFEILEKKEVSFSCDCSRERMERALISLGRRELEDLKADGGAELQCHFCNKKYNFTEKDLEDLIIEI